MTDYPWTRGTCRRCARPCAEGATEHASSHVCLGLDEPAATLLGELILDECAERRWSLDELAHYMGDDAGADATGEAWQLNRVTLDFVLAIDDPQAHIGESTAAGLSRAFGTSATFWLALDEQRVQREHGDAGRRRSHEDE